jgi:hypothetical protein
VPTGPSQKRKRLRYSTQRTPQNKLREHLVFIRKALATRVSAAGPLGASIDTVAPAAWRAIEFPPSLPMDDPPTVKPTMVVQGV